MFGYKIQLLDLQCGEFALHWRPLYVHQIVFNFCQNDFTFSSDNSKYVIKFLSSSY